MRRISGRTLWLIFSCAVLVLVGTAIAADLSTARFASSEHWVTQTQQVKTWMIRLGSDLASAEAARLAFVSSGDPVELPLYESSARRVPLDLSTLQQFTADNPSQQNRLALLRPLIEQRLGLLQESIALAKANSAGQRAQQQRLTVSGAAVTQQIRRNLDEAQLEEEVLLKQRELISNSTYSWAHTVLTLTFVAALLILAVTFWRLLMELHERQQAEEVVRRLSGRLLKVQDEERRRIARELHDSLGQLLTSVKMNLDHLVSHPPGAALQQEMIETCIALAQQGINETRTMSYLLHPPLLDEFGFASAAKWYVDGFAQRSKIDVKLDIDADFGRMPEEIELALFRVLQESLTNIHRHSGSSTAEIKVEKTPRDVSLRVTDHGRGIRAELLEKFRRTRGSTGVGLGGMRERVDELGGVFELKSEPHCTVLHVVIPLREKERPNEKTSSPSRAPESLASQPSSASGESGTSALLNYSSSKS
jgi:signal transduction histidine kinase